jgi:hypothetical protein
VGRKPRKKTDTDQNVHDNKKSWLILRPHLMQRKPNGDSIFPSLPIFFQTVFRQKENIFFAKEETFSDFDHQSKCQLKNWLPESLSNGKKYQIGKVTDTLCRRYIHMQICIQGHPPLAVDTPRAGRFAKVFFALSFLS